MRFSKTTLLRAASLLLLPTTLAQTPPVVPIAPVVHQFPLPTWLENIFATSNGSLLTGTLGFGANLHLVNPFAPNTSPSIDTLLHTFPSYDSILGITEYLPNTFAVITSNYSLTAGPKIGSSTAWKVQFCEKGTLQIGKIADLKGTKMINGIAALNADTVLLADSYRGNVVALSTSTGKYAVVLQDASMAPNTSASTGIGINGLKYNPPHLYFSNTGRNSIHRVQVDALTGKATGAFEKLASVDAPDDFAVTNDGTIFVARPFGNLIERIGVDGSVVPIAAANGTTSVTLGRTGRDRDVLYASTMGGFAADGSFLEGGKVVAQNQTSIDLINVL